MNLRLQKELASKAFGVGKSRVKIDPKDAETVKDAITKADIRSLVDEGVIKIIQKDSTSRHRARERAVKRKKGRMRGYGRRKGLATARTPPKRTWINRVRLQRKTLAGFKEKDQINTADNRAVYKKIKGGFFRSKKHLLQYMEQNKMLKKKQAK